MAITIGNYSFDGPYPSTDSLKIGRVFTQFIVTLTQNTT